MTGELAVVQSGGYTFIWPTSPSPSKMCLLIQAGEAQLHQNADLVSALAEYEQEHPVHQRLEGRLAGYC